MPTKSSHTIEIANEQKTLKIDKRAMRSIVRSVLEGESVSRAAISLAIVDDPTIHRLNRQFLKHDYPTDVLSFVLEHTDDGLDGEIVVSADTAANACSGFGWSPQSELTLYVVHGMLHLIGYDDHSTTDRAKMREREAHYLQQLGVAIPTPAARRLAASRGRRRPGK